jgi:hypothetical protein
MLTSAENQVAQTVTQPVPISLGTHRGVTFFGSDERYSAQNIVLPVDGNRVLVISLSPSDSTAMQAGLTLLSESLSITPKEYCR